MYTDGSGKFAAQRRILVHGCLQSVIYRLQCRLDPRQVEGDKLFLGFAVLTSEDQVDGVRVACPINYPRWGNFVMTVSIAQYLSSRGQDEIRGVSDLDDAREDCLADDVVVYRVDVFRFGRAGIVKN